MAWRLTASTLTLASAGLLFGGDTVTVDDKQPGAEALVGKGGKIVAAGGRADIEKAL